MSGTSFSAEDFAGAFQRFLDWVPTVATGEGGFASRLGEHFGADPSTFPVTALEVAEHDRPNLQVALESYLGQPGCSAELVGLAASSPHIEPSLSQMVARGRPLGFGPGPVGRKVVELDEGRPLACVTMGLFLVSDRERPLAVLVTHQRYPLQTPLVEVMAPEPDPGEAFIAELRGLMVQHNVYRGKVISLSAVPGPMGMRTEVSFHRRRERVARDRIVLADGLLERVERSTIEFDRHADALRAAGRHLRRGLLLHGPPGTGKTLTATYLADALEDRTVMVLTGPALGLIRATCTMARELQPSMVVLEDIDLVAQERTTMGSATTSLLFELLNEIDGMAEDANVIFVMTTNRADLLEPALAARPGRVDQAVEFPLPAAPARERLIGLFCEGLEVELPQLGRLVEQTEGASPAFLRELVRKAALYAVAAGQETVREAHFAEALGELEEGGRLTRSILGAGGDQPPVSPAATGFPPPPGGK